MIKFLLGVSFVFFVALYEQGIYSASISALCLIYFGAVVSLIFRVTEAVKQRSLRIKNIDVLTATTVFICIILAIYQWGLNKQLLLLLFPFMCGLLLIGFVHLKTKRNL
jgi:hypothetical protein